MKRMLLAALLAALLCACGTSPAETTGAPTPTLPMRPTTDAPMTIEIPPEPELYTLSFLAAGDNMAYYGNVREAEKNARGTDAAYDFKPSYTDIKPIVEEYDLAFINQETLMCGEGYDLSYYPRFNVPQELGDAVVDAGFDIVGLANNHMLDKGEDGLLATLSYWEGQPVTSIGSYRDRAAFDEIAVVEKNGIRIALLAFTYETNGLRLPKDSEVYIPYIDEAEIAAKVDEAEEIADLTVVSIHWGNENSEKPNEQQKNIANLICAHGGDVILGHHSHCLQPLCWLENGEQRTLCIYSLGNFMSEMPTERNILAGMLTFTVEKYGKDGKAEVKNARFIPTVFDYDKRFYNNHIFPLSDYTDAQAKAHGIAYYGNSTTLDRLWEIVRRNIPEEFLAQ